MFFMWKYKQEVEKRMRALYQELVQGPEMDMECTCPQDDRKRKLEMCKEEEEEEGTALKYAKCN